MEGGLPLPYMLHSPRQTAGVICGYVSSNFTLSVLPHTFKFHIFRLCEVAFVDNFTQVIDINRKIYARDALNFCATCLM